MEETPTNPFHTPESSTPIRKESSDRTARRSIPTQVRETWRTQSKSIRLALMLYQSSHYRLQELQLLYIADFQSHLDFSQIQKALKFLHTLTTDPRTRDRLWAEYYSVPYLRERPNRLREKRRIGVGYRDKGSLPKNSKPDWNKVNERSVTWRKEIPSILKDLPPTYLESDVRPEEEEPAEDMSDVDRPQTRSKFHSYYLTLVWSLELETLSVSEEIAGFSVPHGTESPSQ